MYLVFFNVAVLFKNCITVVDLFQNDSLKTEDGSVSNAAPDICIAYKLHLECGRLINLYDWLEVSLHDYFCVG